jgi:hypothetical protein
MLTFEKLARNCAHGLMLRTVCEGISWFGFYGNSVVCINGTLFWDLELAM